MTLWVGPAGQAAGPEEGRVPRFGGGCSIEPMRIVTKELGFPVTLLTPTARPAGALAGVATTIRHIAPYLGICQLPSRIILPNNGVVTRPTGW